MSSFPGLGLVPYLGNQASAGIIKGWQLLQGPKAALIRMSLLNEAFGCVCSVMTCHVK